MVCIVCMCGLVCESVSRCECERHRKCVDVSVRVWVREWNCVSVPVCGACLCVRVCSCVCIGAYV